MKLYSWLYHETARMPSARRNSACLCRISLSHFETQGPRSRNMFIADADKAICTGLDICNNMASIANIVALKNLYYNHMIDAWETMGRLGPLPKCSLFDVSRLCLPFPPITIYEPQILEVTFSDQSCQHSTFRCMKKRLCSQDMCQFVV